MPSLACTRARGRPGYRSGMARRRDLEDLRWVHGCTSRPHTGRHSTFHSHSRRSGAPDELSGLDYGPLSDPNELPVVLAAG